MRPIGIATSRAVVVAVLAGLLISLLALPSQAVPRWEKYTDSEGRIKYRQVDDDAPASPAPTPVASGSSTQPGSSASATITPTPRPIGSSRDGIGVPPEGVPTGPRVGPFTVEQPVVRPGVPSTDVRVGPYSIETSTTRPDVAAGPDPVVRTPSGIRFVFNGEPLTNVLEYFSRITGLSILGRTDVSGSVTFYSPRAYTVDEAVGVLNTILISRGMYLKVEADHMKLVPLDQVGKLRVPIYQGTLPTGKVQPSEIVGLVVNLPGGAAVASAQIRPMISTFGSAAALTDRTLMLVDTADNIRYVQSLLSLLTTGTVGPTTRPASVLTIFKLNHMGAEEMFALLRQLLGQPNMRYGPGGDGRPASGLPGPVVADARANSLLVFAPADDVVQMADLIRQLDVKIDRPFIAMETQIFKLENTDANRAADIIRNAYAGLSETRPDGAGRPTNISGEIRVTVDPQFRRLIITATQTRMADIRALLSKVETDTGKSADELFRIVRLTHARANQVSQALRQFVRGSQEMRLDVAEDLRSNSLIIQTNAATLMDRAMALITRLDPKAEVTTQPAEAPATAIRIVELRSVDAAQVVGHVQNLLVQTGKLGEPPVVIDATGDGAALLVACSDTQWPTIHGLIEDLEKLAPDEKSINAIIPLHVAKPTEIERAIQQFYGGSTGYSGSSRPRPSRPATVKTIADDARRVIVVDATPTVMQQVRDLIRRLDVRGVGVDVPDAQTRTYQAANGPQAVQAVESAKKHLADKLIAGQIVATFSVDEPTATIFVTARPNDLAEVEGKLKDVLGQLASRAGMKQFRVAHSPASQMLSLLLAVMGQRPQPANPADQLRLAQDERTNSIVAWGTADAIELVAATIAQLDVSPTTQPMDGRFRAVVIENADPERVAETLTGLFTEINADRAKEGKPAIRFQPDTLTGRLYVIADEEAFKKVAALTDEIEKSIADRPTGIRFVSVRQGDPAAIAQTVSQLYGRWNGRTGHASLPAGIQILPAPSSRSIMVKGDPKSVNEIALLIEKLDAPGADQEELRTYECDGGKQAGALKEALTRAFAADIQAGRMKAAFEAEADAAVLFVTARQGDFARIEATINQLKARATAMNTLRRLAVTHGDGRALADVVEQIVTSQGGRIKLAATPDGRFLIASGSTTDIDTAARVVGELDQPTANSNRLRQFPVADGNAWQWVSMLQAVLISRSGGAGSAEPIRLSADPAGTMIFAFGSPDQLDTVAKLLGSIRVDDPAIRIIPVARGEAAALANTLRESLGLGQPRRSPAVAGSGARVAADPGSNCLIVTGPSGDVAAVEKLAADLDKGNPNGAQVRLIKVENADPADLVELLTDLLVKQGGGRGSPLSLAVDPGGNRLIVNASAQQIATIEGIVRQLDVKPENPVSMHWISVLSGKPGDVLDKIKPIVEAKYGKRGPSLLADPITGSVIFTGNQEQYLYVSSLVDDLCKGVTGDAGDEIVTEIIPIKDTSAARMAGAIQSVHQQIQGTPVKVVVFQSGTGTPSLTIRDLTQPTPSPEVTPPTTRPDRRSRSDASGPGGPGTLGGFPNAWRAMLLAQPAPPASPPATPSAGPTDPQPPVGPGVEPPPDGVEAPASTGGSKVGTGTRLSRPSTQPSAVAPTIFVDQTTNALIVTGTASQVRGIRDLLDSLADSTGGPDFEFRVYKLSACPPDSMADILERLFNGRSAGQQGVQPVVQPVVQPGANGRGNTGRPGASGQPNATGQPGSGDAAAAAMQRQAQIQQAQQAAARAAGRRIVVVPDLRTNAVIVKASTADFAVIEPVVRAMDVELKGTALEVQIFALGTIDATEAERNLKELFRLVSGGGAAGSSKNLEALREQVIQMSRQGKAPSEADMVKLVNAGRMTITANQAANSIIVAAPPEGLMLVKLMLDELDKAVIINGSVKQIPLANARAESLAPVLENLFGSRRRTGSGPTGGTRQPSRSRDISLTVQAEPQSNRLLVRAAPADMEEIERLVKDLDKAGPENGGVEVYHLKFADPTQLARAIQDMHKPERGGQTTVKVAVDPSTSSMLVHANPVDQQRIKAMIEKMDADNELVPQTKVFTLKSSAQAADVAQSIGVTLRGWPKKQGRPAPQVSAEPTTNVVIVMAVPDDLRTIGTLIEQIDGAGTGATPVNQQGINVLPLGGADAAKTAAMLNTLLRQAYPNAKFSITADARTNSLIVRGPENVVGEVKALIEKLDRVPPMGEAVMTIVPLKNASAAKLAPIIQAMLKRDAKGAVTPAASALQEQIRRMKIVGKDGKPISELDLDKPLNVLAEEGINALIISSTQNNVTALTAVLEVLDVKPQVDAVTMRVFPVKHGDAALIGQQLTDLFTRSRQMVYKPGGGSPALPGQVDMGSAVGRALMNQVTVSVDKRTNTIVAAGVEESVALVEVLIRQLDTPASASNIETRILPVRHGDSGALVPMLTQLFDKRLAASVAPGMQPLPSDKVSLAVEPVTNSILAVGKKENLDQLVELLGKLDIEPPASSGVVKYYVLDYADASTLADMITQIFKAGVYVPGKVSVTGQQVRPEDKVACNYDGRTNALIVSASKQNLTIVEEMIRQLDKDLPQTEAFKLFPVANTDVTKVAQVLTDLFNKKAQADKAAGGKGIPPAIISDSRSNTLIVVGKKTEFADVESLLKDLDKLDAKSAVDFKLVPLKNASAATLGPTLTDLMSKRRTGAGGAATTPVSIAIDQGSNTLIIAATRDDMQVVSDLIDKLDKTPENLENTRIFPLLLADATVMGETLTKLYSGRPDAKNIHFSIDPRLNALIVQAAKGDMDALADIIKRLDNAPIESLVDLKVFALENAEATTLAQILTDVLKDSKSTTGRVTGPKATIVNFLASDARAAQAISTQKEKIVVTPDARTNSLVVTAPTESMAMMVLLIKEMDKPSRVLTQVEIYQLKNADAGQMAEIIKDLFGIGSSGSNSGTNRNNRNQQPQQQWNMPMYPYGPYLPPVQPVNAPAGSPLLGGPLGGSPAPAGPGAPAAPPAIGGAPAIGGSSAASPGGATAAGTPPSPFRPPLSVVVDSRTNGLICTGVAEDLSVVQQLVEKLDSSDVVERVNKVYALRNAKAPEIQKALADFLKQETQRLVNILGPDQAKNATKAIEKEISVVAVEASNQLLVSASPRYYDQVAQIVNELDQLPPQVLIQVLLAEVTLDDTFALGFEASQAIKVGDGTLKAGSNFGLVANDTGFSVNLTGTDFEFVLNALQTQERLEVLSRPQVLASDNQEANISVGERVPFVTDVRTNTDGSLNQTVQYQDVGIILKVTPKINPDGFVNMMLAPEISGIADSSVTIGSGSYPKFTKRAATTTVTVKDNQTIVIGGLIRTSESNVAKKVPGLGDLPGLLGAPWRSTKTVKQRTELLIVVTPRVLRTVEDAARVSSQERDRMSIMPRNIENTDLMNIRSPEGPPFSQPIDTRYRSPEAPKDAPKDAPADPGQQGRGPVPMPDAVTAAEGPRRPALPATFWLPATRPDAMSVPH